MHGSHLLHFHKLWVHNLMIKMFPQQTASPCKHFRGKFQTFLDHLFGLLEYVDKLCGVFAVLLGEEGVGGASVAFSPGSADPADFFWR